MGFIQQWVSLLPNIWIELIDIRNAEQAVRNMLLKATEQAGTNVLQVSLVV